MLNLQKLILWVFLSLVCYRTICVAGARNKKAKDKPVVICHYDTFRCVNGDCIPKAGRCDGKAQCKDQSDEAHCDSRNKSKTCTYQEFTCDSGECIGRGGLCNSVVNCVDRSDENITNCPNGTTPLSWTEYWHSPESVNQNVSLVHKEGNIAVYFGTGVNASTKWPFGPLSSTWQYIKNTYGPFGQNPHLYVILHQNSNSSSPSTTVPFTNKRLGFRNLISCSHPEPKGDGWAPKTKHNFERLFSNFGILVQEGAQGMKNDADSEICGDQISDIIFYDIYSYVPYKGKPVDAAARWADAAAGRRINLTLKSNSTSKSKTVNCFKDWFLPIYEKYGGVSVLRNFFLLTKLHWPTTTTTTTVNESQKVYTKLNVGEFVHFWSEAAGVDLEPDATKTFNWTSVCRNELVKARETYSFFNRTVRSYTEAYLNKATAVSIYSKNYPIHRTETYEKISKAWAYAKRAYGPFQPTNCSSHVIVLPIKAFLAEGQSDSNSCIPLNEILKNKTTESLTIINCTPTGTGTGTGSSANLTLDTTNFVDDITRQIGKMALRLKNGTATGSWPGREVSGWTMSTIIVYDIHVSLKGTVEARRWREKKLTENEGAINKTPVFWFRDWYLPIYEKYNGQVVLKKFMTLLNSHWPLQVQGGKGQVKQQNLRKQLNMGEFLHFWCEAAGLNLESLANKSIGWNRNYDNYTRQFLKAKAVFPSFKYGSVGANSTANKQQNIVLGKGKGNVIPIVVGVIFVLLLLIGLFTAIRMKMYLARKRFKSVSQQGVW